MKRGELLLILIIPAILLSFILITTNTYAIDYFCADRPFDQEYGPDCEPEIDIPPIDTTPPPNTCRCELTSCVEGGSFSCGVYEETCDETKGLIPACSSKKSTSCQVSPYSGAKWNNWKECYENLKSGEDPLEECDNRIEPEEFQQGYGCFDSGCSCIQAACSDGIDNDNPPDGLIDFNDPGCFSRGQFGDYNYEPWDNDESEPTPRDCGSKGESCCSSEPLCDPGLNCINNKCVITTTEESCGVVGEQCCSGSTCDKGNYCATDNKCYKEILPKRECNPKPYLSLKNYEDACKDSNQGTKRRCRPTADSEYKLVCCSEPREYYDGILEECADKGKQGNVCDFDGTCNSGLYCTEEAGEMGRCCKPEEIWKGGKCTPIEPSPCPQVHENPNCVSLFFAGSGKMKLELCFQKFPPTLKFYNRVCSDVGFVAGRPHYYDLTGDVKCKNYTTSGRLVDVPCDITKG